MCVISGGKLAFFILDGLQMEHQTSAVHMLRGSYGKKSNLFFQILTLHTWYIFLDSLEMTRSVNKLEIFFITCITKIHDKRQ